MKKYIELREKSNLGSYLKHHLSEVQLTEIEPMLNEIKKRIEITRAQKYMDRLEDDENWSHYDPSHLVQLSQQYESTVWMAELFVKCTRAIEESDYYTTFAIPNTLRKKTERRKEGEPLPNALFTELNPGARKELHCPKDGHIVVDLNWSEDTSAPVEIYGIEYLGRLMGENPEFQSAGEEASELLWGNSEFNIGEWLSGKELLFYK